MITMLYPHFDFEFVYGHPISPDLAINKFKVEVRIQHCYHFPVPVSYALASIGWEGEL